MNKNDLFDLIRDGENSGVEFKRDDVEPRALAKEIVAGMKAFNRTQPRLIEEGESFTVALLR